jgi:hypothetical protein
MILFQKRTKPLELEGHTFEVWLNPPRGPMQEHGQKGNGPFLAYLIQKWSIAGQEYEGYVFPENVTEEAINQLPVDFQEQLSMAVGEAIRDALPKPKKSK